MARFHGVVGFGETSEQPAGSGKWVDTITERTYTGDVVRSSRLLEAGEGLNDDIKVNNSIRIVADTYAIDNVFAIRYVQWRGVLWTVTSVEDQRPRLLFSLGDVYNGPVPPPPEDDEEGGGG